MVTPAGENNPTPQNQTFGEIIPCFLQQLNFISFLQVLPCFGLLQLQPRQRCSTSSINSKILYLFGFPGLTWIIPCSWKCPRPVWTGLGTTQSGARCPCPFQPRASRITIKHLQFCAATLRISPSKQTTIHLN